MNNEPALKKRKMNDNGMNKLSRKRKRDTVVIRKQTFYNPKRQKVIIEYTPPVEYICNIHENDRDICEIYECSGQRIVCNSNQNKICVYLS